jgi:hypothetical protein
VHEEVGAVLAGIEESVRDRLTADLSTLDHSVRTASRPRPDSPSDGGSGPPRRASSGSHRHRQS